MKEVKIGDQIWSSENLNVENFINGEPIGFANSIEEWQDAASYNRPVCCYYEHKTKNGNKFGKLYNWHCINDTRGLAPKGWRIATLEDFNKLFDYIRENGGNVLQKLKSSDGWVVKDDDSIYDSDYINGTDEFSFCVLPAGTVEEDGTFKNLGQKSIFWTSESKTAYTAIAIDAFDISCPDTYDDLSRDIYKLSRKNSGLSIRLIKEII